MKKNVEINLTNIPKELQLIIEIVKSEKADDVSEQWYVDTDWDLFLQLALHHRLYPLLFKKIRNSKNGWIPSYISDAITGYYRKNTFRMLHLCGEMEKLSKLFAENNIRPLFLKGPVLAADLYGDISERTCGDLDILIPIDSLDEADQLLVEIGYEKDEYIHSVLNDWKWRHHHYTYYHPTQQIKVEIHWRLNPSPSKEPAFNELWNRKRQSKITSYPTYFLGNEDLFFFLVTHGARHGWSRLRWLVDIHHIVKKDLRWEELHCLLKRYQSSNIAGQSLILSSQLLDTTIMKGMEPLIKVRRPKKLAQEAVFYMERMVNLHSEPVPVEIATYHTKHLFSLMTRRQKMLYFLSVLHPYYTDVETLSLPEKLHILYFPLRPILWLWRKTKKYALS